MNKFNVWIVLLIVSVLINGVLIGAHARLWLDAPPAPSAPQQLPPERPTFSLRAFMQALPEDRQADVRARFQAAGPELRELGRDAWRARERAYAALRAEPFDPAAASAATEAARAARARFEARSEAVILDSLAGMDAATRQQAIEATLSPRRPPPERRRERAGGEPG